MKARSWISRLGGVIAAALMVSTALADPAMAGTDPASLPGVVDPHFPPAGYDRLHALGAATICADAYLAGYGWQGWNCDADGRAVLVGTTGQHRAIEALSIGTFG